MGPCICYISSIGGGTRGPGVLGVGQSQGPFAHRRSEAPGAFQARDEGRSQRPSQDQSQLLRRQSSPALSREVSAASQSGAPAPPWLLPYPRCRAGPGKESSLFRVAITGVQLLPLPKSQQLLEKLRWTRIRLS